MNGFHRNKKDCRGRGRRGLTLVEVVMAMVIVAGLLVAALNTVGASRTSEQRMLRRSRGMLLAQELMAEIMEKAYRDPNDPPLFGPESTETPTSRATFDDVDDYHNWTESPPQNTDGSAITEFAGWRRSVIVVYANPADVQQAVAGDQGLKRVTVTVTCSGVPVAELVAIKSDSP